jgi:hypothetical protein
MYTVNPGDRLQLRKAHPCGSDEWLVYRIGADVGLRCAGCGRRVLLPNATLQKRIKKIISAGAASPPEGECT